MKDTTPKISIIIAAKNCGHCIGQALNSITNQYAGNIECIVVDGASVDSTIDVLKGYPENQIKWISEPDGGIAEAFNKGIALSSGRLIHFLGADDRLYDDQVIEDVSEYLQCLRSPYFFYGDIYYDYGQKQKLVEQNYNLGKFKKYNCLPHQAMFIDRWFFEQFGLFDTSYRYAMDYEHIARYIESEQPQYFKRIIAQMQRSGISTDVLPVHQEMDRVRLRQGWATTQQVSIERLLLKVKHRLAKLMRLDW